MIKFAIPGMYELCDINFRFLKLMKCNPDYFYDDVEVEAVYGNPQFCIWDGGRIFRKYEFATQEKISEIINIYNFEFKIKTRYIFTNCVLEQKHYNDRFGNILMELGAAFNNEVVVADDRFVKFLKKKYPSYNYISSTTKCLSDKESAKIELNKEYYDLVCLDYNLNKNWQFLESFTSAEKEKTEFLINAICPPKCKHRKDHYYLNSIYSLSYGKKYNMEYCSIRSNTVDPETRKHYITHKDIKEKYIPLGFEHFKIEGRTLDPLEVLFNYCQYMVKPEYRDFVILKSLPMT